MRRINKTIASLLIVTLLFSVALIAGPLRLSASAALEKEARGENGGMICVSLRIEGAEKAMYHNTAIEIAAGATVLDLLTTADELDDTLEITIDEGTYGFAYIPKINGLSEFDYGGYSGWMFLINGDSGIEGISEAVLEDDDEVIVYFSDQWGAPGFQFPEADVSKLLSDGVIKFTSEDTDYDENWNAVTATKPVAGATVTLGGAKHTTDDNGEITLADVGGLAGLLSLQIEKYDEDTGVPTVLRYAPDHVLYIPFHDAPQGAWYDDALEYCVRERLFIGLDAEANLFAPLATMNMLQLLSVLERVAGPAPTITPIDWAFANDIVKLPEAYEDMLDDLGALYDFFTKTTVTRSGFIHMFFLATGLAGTHDMDVRADITGATDYDELCELAPDDASWLLDSVSWAVAVGLIRGVDENALTISAGTEVTRAEVCQMLYNYYK